MTNNLKTYLISDDSGSRCLAAATADAACVEYQRLERIRARVETVADLAAAVEADGGWLVVREFEGQGEDLTEVALVYMTKGV